MALAEPKTAQLRVTKNSIIAEGSEGQIFYASPTRAKLLIDAGAAELVNVQRPAGPAVAKVPGPTQTKPAEPLEKKESFPVVPAGRLTDSAPSIKSGPAEPSPSLEAVRALPKPNARTLHKPKPKAKRTR